MSKVGILTINFLYQIILNAKIKTLKLVLTKPKQGINMKYLFIRGLLF